MCLRRNLGLSEEVSCWSFIFPSKIKSKSTFSLYLFYDFTTLLISLHFLNNVTCQLNKNPIFWWPTWITHVSFSSEYWRNCCFCVLFFVPLEGIVRRLSIFVFNCEDGVFEEQIKRVARNGHWREHGERREVVPTEIRAMSRIKSIQEFWKGEGAAERKQYGRCINLTLSPVWIN